MATLTQFGVKAPEMRTRSARVADLLPLLNTVQRVRKLFGIAKRFNNVDLTWVNALPQSADEWALVVEVNGVQNFEVKAYLLRTEDKAKAMRRVYGWGLRDKDGDLNWPPIVPDDDPYIAYGPDPDEIARIRGRLPY